MLAGIGNEDLITNVKLENECYEAGRRNMTGGAGGKVGRYLKVGNDLSSARSGTSHVHSPASPSAPWPRLR